MENYPIDFVITWVDGNDPKWQEEKAKYKGQDGDDRNSRYRDWDTVRFLLRSMEKCTPWVNRIFFVTCGHLPAWLNTDNAKLRVVRHDEYIPREFLPTFASRTIDMNFHRIADLSEHFVYFNDDMLLLRKLEKEDFFKKGLPKDTAVLRPAVVKSNRFNAGEKTSEMYLAPIVDMALINKHFRKHKVIRRNLSKWFSPVYGKEMIKTLSLAPWNFFPGIREYHCCYSYLKKTYEELWEKEGEAFEEVCSHRFRVNTDYNHWVFSYWQMAKGDFYPRTPKFGEAFSLNDDENNNEKIFQSVLSGKYSLVCLNDSVSGDKYPDALAKLTECLTKLYPERSSFEK